MRRPQCRRGMAATSGRMPGHTVASAGGGSPPCLSRRCRGPEKPTSRWVCVGELNFTIRDLAMLLFGTATLSRVTVMKVGRAPINLNDLPLDATFQGNPVAN